MRRLIINGTQITIMQIGKSITFYLTLLVIFQSCDGKKSTNYQQVIKEYDKKGNLLRKYFVNNLKQKNGRFYEYYDNKNIKFEFSYLNGHPNGEQKQYYQNGVLQAIGYYKNSKPDSLQKWFFPSGIQKSESFWLEGKLFGIQKNYYENGNLKSAFFMRNDSDQIFSFNLDSNGRIIDHSKGIIYAIYEKDYLESIDSAKIVFYTFALPSTTSKYELIEKKDGKVNSRSEIKLSDINNTPAYLFYKKLGKRGDYEIGVSINLKDRYNNMISDSLFVPLKVR
ncbi:MAG: hypothetical protein JSU05_11910 [Bacteroidetes bacterium]|nr:hypothetical protein [Bacteroidota bacterium]